MLMQYVRREHETPWRVVGREAGRDVKVNFVLGATGEEPEALHSIQSGCVVPSHFHEGSQFQLVLKGFAEFSTFTLRAPAVHYTDHNVAYGPFRTSLDYEMYALHAGPAGQLVVSDRVARKKLNKRGRELCRSADEVEWRSSRFSPTAREKLLLDEPTGLRVEIFEGTKDAEIAHGPAPFGRYEIVLRGSVSVGGEELDPYDLRFVKGDETAPPVRFCRDRSTLIVLHFDPDAGEGSGRRSIELIEELEAAHAAGDEGKEP